MNKKKFISIMISSILTVLCIQQIFCISVLSDYPIRSPLLHGDVDQDGDVDLSDLAQLLAHYGTSDGANWEEGDVEPYLDGDGDVDLSDLAELLAHYGETS